MKKGRSILILIALAVIGVIILFTSFVGDTMRYASEPSRADAIVVLTGGRGRAREGLNLLRRGDANLLILSGVHEDADVDSIFLKNISDDERLRIILEKRSTSTYSNAMEAAKVVREKGIRSIILMTSIYHMKRSEYIFKKVLPSDIRIETYSVLTPNFDESRWWTGNTLVLLAVEFVKYYGFVAWFTFNGLF